MKSILLRLKQLLFTKELMNRFPRLYKWGSLAKSEFSEHIVSKAPQFNSINLEVNQEKENQKKVQLLIDIGTGFWRIRRKVFPPEMKVIPKEMRGIELAFESISDILKKNEVEIRDHTGEIITGGEALQVVAFQPTNEVNREKVIETIKPTIYYKGRIAQMGTVIVGIPED